MDVIYIAAAAVFWLVVVGLARGCALLQNRGARS